jgi:hypothetical protein
VTIAAGAYYIYSNQTSWITLIFGAAIVAVGLYLLIMEGVDLLRGG